MALFPKKSKSLVGIDIGSKNIKVAELEKKKDETFELKNYAFGMIEGFSARTGTAQQVSKVLATILDKSDIDNKQVAMSLPAYSTFLSLAKVPEMDDAELEDAVKFEAKKYIPVPLSEVTLGWSRSQDKILLIAVPKKLSLHYAEIANLAGLDLKGLEAETFSLVRALADKEKGLVMIVDQGSHSTNISLARDGQIVSNYTTGADVALTEEVPKLLKNGKETVKKIILSGGGIKKELVASLGKVVGPKIKVEIGSPWKSVVYPKELTSALDGLASFLPAAIGLAKRNYD